MLITHPIRSLMPGHFRSLRFSGGAKNGYNIILKYLILYYRAKWPDWFFLMTDNDRSLMTRCLLTICVFSLALGRLFSQDSGKLNSRFRKTIASYNTFLYLCTSNRKKASLVPDVGLNRRQAPVVNDGQNKGKKWGRQVHRSEHHQRKGSVETRKRVL